MSRKDNFFKSADFENIKKTNNLEELILKLIDKFESEGFSFYPAWRVTDKSGEFKKFTFKVNQPAEKNENLITVHPQSNELKVEIYRNQNDITYYRVKIENIDDPAQMKPLLDDAKRIYNSISLLGL